MHQGVWKEAVENGKKEEKCLRIAAILTLAVCALLVVGLQFFPKTHALATEAAEAKVAEGEYADSQIEMQSMDIADEADSGTITMSWQLALRIPDGVLADDVTVTNDYVTQTVRIEIPSADEDYFESGPLVGSSSHIDAISYASGNSAASGSDTASGEYTASETGVVSDANATVGNGATSGNGAVSGESGSGSNGILQLAMDGVYELESSHDENYFYFNFIDPHEAYDKIVVIDAGHGGRAPGATKQGIKEKDIDLAIVRELADIFAESDGSIGVFYTRTDDSNPTFDQRVQLANLLDADLFVSVHNNSLGSGKMSDTKGTEVMYDETSEESKRFAQICSEEVTAATGSENRGLVKGDSIYIIRNSEVPVALIEVGFMTNAEELSLLDTAAYQRKAAEGIYNAIVRAFDEGF